MMSSRERVRSALEHKEPDRLPVDQGASAVTGMHVSLVYQLRQAHKLDEPLTPVKERFEWARKRVPHGERILFWIGRKLIPVDDQTLGTVRAPNP